MSTPAVDSVALLTVLYTELLYPHDLSSLALASLKLDILGPCQRL